MDKGKIKQEFDDGLEIPECELKTEDVHDAPLMSESEIKIEPDEHLGDAEIKSECANDMLVDNIDSLETKTESGSGIKTETYEEHSLKWESLKKEKIDDGLEESSNKEEEYVERERPFQCEVCNESFTTSQNFKIHSRIHTGEKPYKCEVCNKSFTKKYYLMEHSRIHAGEKPFQCEVCNTSFRYRSNFIRHSKTHTGEKLFMCEICNKSFTSKASLIKHLRIHTDKKLFICAICNKSFATIPNLILHSRIHTGLKPYKCKVCGKSFNQKNHLTEHSSIHTR